MRMLTTASVPAGTAASSRESAAPLRRSASSQIQV
jgi:hypothetical protein